MTSREVSFEELVGEHMLSGVEMGAIPASESDYWDRNVVDFILDDRVFSASEDPNNGYRSCMRAFVENRHGVKIRNRFRPVKVVARHIKHDNDGECSILELADVVNKKAVLRVGTSYDDWYPYFVNEWTPENLSINEKKYTTRFR